MPVIIRNYIMLAFIVLVMLMGLSACAAGNFEFATQLNTSSGEVVTTEAAASHRGKENGHHKDDDPRPFDKTRDAMADVDATLAAAERSGRKPLLVLGANWCHDSRGLAARFLKPRFGTLIEQHYEILYVDVGKRDRNLDVAERFGVEKLIGTPTVLVLSTEGQVLNADTASRWRRAYSISDDETYDYFLAFAEGRPWSEPNE